jgi:CRP/FNR family transcriptional regulator, cyclic AMP receptor protein
MYNGRVTASLSVFTNPQVASKTIHATNGTVVCEPHSPAESVYYIQSGQVRLYTVGPDDSTHLIEILGAGQWFGAAALAGADSCKTRAVCVGITVLREFRIEQLLAALSNDPQQLIEFNRQLAVRLLAATEEASRLVFEDCNQRLISALIRFSRSVASTQHDDGVVLRITHDQLAQAVGVARETVSLALTQLRQQNLLRTGRNQLVFNPDVLRQFSDRRTSPSDGMVLQDVA